MTSQDQFTAQDVAPVYTRLWAGGHEPIIIGGQAVNFWVEYCRPLAPRAFGPRPLASKDLDLLGARGVVMNVAKILGVKMYLPAKDHATPEAGYVLVPMDDGRELKIDFLSDSMPNDEKAIRESMIPFDVDGGRFYVMHPALCLKSRVHNVIRISSKYDTPHGREQMLASIKVVPIFCQDLLNEGGEAAEEDVMEVYKDLYKYSRTVVPRLLWREKGIDTFDAVKPLRGMKPGFAEECYPRWMETIGREST